LSVPSDYLEIGTRRNPDYLEETKIPRNGDKEESPSI